MLRYPSLFTARSRARAAKVALLHVKMHATGDARTLPSQRFYLRVVWDAEGTPAVEPLFFRDDTAIGALLDLLHIPPHKKRKPSIDDKSLPSRAGRMLDDVGAVMGVRPRTLLHAHVPDTRVRLNPSTPLNLCADLTSGSVVIVSLSDVLTAERWRAIDELVGQ